MTIEVKGVNINMHMKNLPKNSIFFSLAFILAASSILCCCLSMTSFAHAEDVETAESNTHCHSHEADSANSSESEECECHYSDAVLANLNLDLLKSDLSLAKIFDEEFLLNYSSRSLDNSSSMILEHAPLRLYRRGVPYYLEHSILRI